MNTFFICEVDSFCVVILLLLFWIGSKTTSLTANQKYFNKFIFLTIIFSLSEMADWLFRTCMPISVFAIGLTWLANFAYFISSVSLSKNWLFYVVTKINESKPVSVKKKHIAEIPFVLFSIFVLLTPFTKILFIVTNENLYFRGPGIWIHMTITYMYIFVATLYALIHMRKEKNKRRKQEVFVPLILFIIMPLIASVMQLCKYNTPIVQISLTLDALMIFLSQQTQLVSKDPLTGINNRGQFDRYMDSKIDEMKKSDTILVTMIDVDSFKKINDVYGHLVGDKALIEVATILKNTCAVIQNKVFLARYGGDEFVISAINPPENLQDDLERVLAGKIKESNENSSDEFKISLSVGTVVAPKKSFEKIEDVIKKADKKMYADKQQKKKLKK